MATQGTTNVKLQLISFCGITYLYFQLLHKATPARKTNYIPGEERILRCIWHSQGDEYDHQEHPGRDNMDYGRYVATFQNNLLSAYKNSKLLKDDITCTR
jgi:hypothetical protein